MKINEIKTERITRGNLEYYIKDIYSSIKFYGKLDNKLFMMNDQNTGIFDLDSDKYIIYSKRGISYPVVDSHNNNYFMIISSKNNDEVRYNFYGQPRYDDTNKPRHMYDNEIYFRDTECYCNVFDENNESVQPFNKYLANIYQFNSMLDENAQYRTITYRDIDDGNYCPNDNNKYTSYDNLPIHINGQFKHVLSLDSIARTEDYNSIAKNKGYFNLDVVYTKWKYSVINRDKGLIITYDSDIKDVQVIDNDIIMLKNSDKLCAIYDVNNGYLINFDDNIEFDNAYKLAQNIFKLQDEKGYRFLIKNNISTKTYKSIYMTSDNIIICNGFNDVDLYTTNGDLILNINSNYFYKCDDDIFYLENNKFYHYNLNSSIKKEMNILSLFRLEDGTKLNLSIDEVLENFTYCYYDRVKKEFILFKEKKFGIGIDLGGTTKSNRWFNSIEQKEKYFQVLSDFLLNIPLTNEIDNSGNKRKTKKLNQ